MKNKDTDCLVCGSHNIEKIGSTYKCTDCGAFYTENDIVKCEHCDGDALDSMAIYEDGLYFCCDECYDFSLKLFG